MELEVIKKDGGSSGTKMKLPKHVFGVEPNEHAVYLAIKVQTANARQGNASTKTRSMVRGGGKKPWKQKGRGGARAGTIRSPLWVGGGRVFGPHKRDYTQSLPRKVKSLARISVFADRAKSGQIKVVEDFTLDEAKTKEMFNILKSLGCQGQRTLLLLADYDAKILRAARNIPKLEVRVAASESTYDLLKCENLILQKSAVDKIAGAFKK